jgi:hypothetical protein
MPIDHYVSQVHLKNFYSPRLGDLMYAIRKSDLMSFTPNAQSVCRIENGSTNLYLREDRAIEEFLKGIEPKYNRALEKLKTDNIDSECIYVIAGFVAYVLMCSPAGMRIQSEWLKGVVEETARRLDSKGSFSAPPPELGGGSLIELMNSGRVSWEIDPKFPQAISISSILSQTVTFGNFTWDVLINPFEDSPFFTSDFPVAIEKTEDLRVLNRVVPLSPNLGIRIRPDLSFDEKRTDYFFSGFRYVIRKLSRAEVVNINRLIVRCAESIIFFRDEHEWIPKFVEKNAAFRIEPKTDRRSHRDGTLLMATQEIKERLIKSTVPPISGQG